MDSTHEEATYCPEKMTLTGKWCAIAQLRPTIAALESHSLSAKVLDQDEVRRSRT